MCAFLVHRWQAFADLGMNVDAIKGAVQFADRDDENNVTLEAFTRELEQMDDNVSKRETWEVRSKINSIETKVDAMQASIQRIEAAVCGSFTSAVTKPFKLN